MQQLILSRLYFTLFFVVIALIGVSSMLEVLYVPSLIAFVALHLFLLIDILLLSITGDALDINRTVSERLNLGDENKVRINVFNRSKLIVSYSLIDGYPVEMQERKLKFKGVLMPSTDQTYHYSFTPHQRGDVFFGNVFVQLFSILHLCARRIEFEKGQTTKVYPSVLQLKKYELLVFHQQKTVMGIKRMRRLGNNQEFEQIKEYVQGDEIKTINWKATSRTNSLRVNKYQEEKSQQMYCVIDKSRSMQMEFEQLSLLDHSINSALVLSNIMLRNGDKTGLLTFSDKMGSVLPADKSSAQMRMIMEALYNQKTKFLEPNYEVLYQSIRNKVKSRSLLMLYTNFETLAALDRALPMLRKINQKHVLVVVLFKNSDVEALSLNTPKSVREVYRSIIAEQMTDLKSMIAKRIRQNGIHVLLTDPEHLSISTINKYLEVKSRGIL